MFFVACFALFTHLIATPILWIVSKICKSFNKICKFIKTNWKDFLLVLSIIVGSAIVFYFVIIPGSVLLGVILFVVWLITLFSSFCYVIFLILKNLWKVIKYLFVPEKVKIEGNVIEFSESHLSVDNSDASNNNFSALYNNRYGMQSDYYVRVSNGVNEYEVSLEKQLFEKIKDNFSKGLNNFCYFCKKYKWGHLWRLQ